MRLLNSFFKVARGTSRHSPSVRLAAAEIQLANSNTKFRILNEQSDNGIIIMSPDGFPSFAASSVSNVLGYTEDEMLQANLRTLVHHSTLQIFESTLAKTVANPGEAISCSLELMHKEGRWCYIEATFTNLCHDPIIAGIVMNFRDTTSHKETSDKLTYANRLYSVISMINQTIVHTKDEGDLYQNACRIAVEHGGFGFAWIGFVDTDHRKIHLKVSAGAAPQDLDYFTDYTYDLGGPIENVIQGQDYFVVDDIENKSNRKFVVYAHERGFKSAICLPLKKSGVVIGTFNLYSSDRLFFNPQEISLLKEATGDISFALDVLESDRQRTLAEQRLQYSEFRLKQAQEIAHLGSWELDFSTGIAIWSQEALRIFGIPNDQNIQSYESWLSYIHPDDLNYVAAVTEKTEFTTDPVAFFHRIVRPDGSVRYLYSQAQTEMDDSGKGVAMRGIIHDVTDAKIIETALMESQAKLRLIVDTIPQAICAKDINGEIVFANKSFASIFGMNSEQLLKKNIKALAGGKQLAKYLELDPHTEGSSVQELNITDFDGNERIFNTTKIPYTIPGESAQAVLAIASDITQGKSAEYERTKMMSDIVQRNKDLEQFSYIVSHNLRAPLANIMGLSTELEDEEHNADIRKILHFQLSKSVLRLDSVISDLNRILQLKTEIIEEREEVNLDELIQDIKSSLSNLVADEHVQFKVDFDITTLHTLKSYQHSIFYNLISNSIKYRCPEAAPVIEIKTRKTKKGVRISFRDNGVGIDLNKERNQIFGLYKRFHHHVEGKGIGLFMVKTQVETLGGKISVRSVIGAGTEFIIDYDS